jgi:hypothetical protein
VSAAVIRTDFSDPDAWAAIRRTITAPIAPYGFLADVRFVDDRANDGRTVDDLVRGFGDEPSDTYVIVADRTTFEHPEHPLIVVDLFEEIGRTFRALPAQIQSVENNLSLANMDFEDFSGSVDQDGIFRGFS